MTKIILLLLFLAASKNSLGCVEVSFSTPNDLEKSKMLETIRTRKLLRMPIDTCVCHEILNRDEIDKEKKISALNTLAQKNNSNALGELLGFLEHTSANIMKKRTAYEILIMWNKEELRNSIKDIENLYKKKISADLNKYLVAAQLRAGKISIITNNLTEECLEALLILEDKKLLLLYSSKITEELLNIDEKKSTVNFKKSILKACQYIDCKSGIINRALIRIGTNKKHPLKFQAIKSLNVKNDGDWKKTHPELTLQTINIFAEKGTMRYQPKLIEIVKKRPVELVFTNSDNMEHNLLICSPGSLYKIGAAADLIKKNKDAKKNNFKISLREVLFSIDLVPPGEMKQLFFDAPAVPEEYPFICTFPDHWRVMNGILKVVDGHK